MKHESSEELGGEALMEHYREKLEAEQKKDAERLEFIRSECEMLDDDGYPTEEALEAIELWPWTDKKGWFDFIGNIWAYRGWGWKEEDAYDEWYEKNVHRYSISTAGWSGNESIIYSMERNKNFLWSMTWVQSRRGGHYIFENDGELK